MSTDDLAEIDGIKPKVILVDGEETEVKSKTSKSVYKVKRTADHFYCTCPAWRNQKGVRVETRSCKHLQEVLGEEYETARLKLKNGDSNKPTSASKKASKPESKPQSKGKGRASAKRKRDDDDDDDDEDKEEEEEEDVAPSKPSSSKKPNSKKPESKKPESKKPNSKKPTSKSAPVKQANKGKEKAKIKTEDDEVDNEDPNDDDAEDKMDIDGGNTTSPPDGSDELAEIDGIKPQVYMADGAEKEVKSQTSSSTYKVKRTWDHYYCTCPAWRNQGGVPVNARSCKHLQSLLGHDYEAARIKLRNPDGPQLGSGKGKSTRSTKKAKKDDGDDGKGNPELLLANKWDLASGPDPTGWWVSEKLDGVRTFYDGKGMVSRLGNPFTPPQWFLDKLPKDVTLDGELFGGRGEFQSTVSIVKTVNSPHWQKITFQIFDIPSRGDEPFEKRIEFLKKLFGENGSHASEQVVVVEHEKAKNRDHVLEKLKEIEALGGEGLMLRKPGSEYEGRRSATLLKVKTFYDAEAIVTGYEDGKGRNKGVTGSLVCKMESGKRFNVGSGLSDKQRKNPPKIGTIIVYRFQELTKDGVPRFPTFVGEAIDKKEPKDAEVPAHRKGGKSSDD